MDDAARDATRVTRKPNKIAEVLRERIVSGELSGVQSLGKEPLLVKRFGVSRPAEGDSVEAQDPWHEHMRIIGRVMLGRRASTVVDLLDDPWSHPPRSDRW